MRGRRPWRAAITMVIAAVTLQLSGCAIEQHGGRTVSRLDPDDMFATELATIPLKGTSQATLRRSPNEDFSIKVKDSMRAISLGKLQSAQVMYRTELDDDVVVIVRTVKQGCLNKYRVLAFSTGPINSWEIGNCRDELAYGIDGNKLILQLGTTYGQHYIYRDHALSGPFTIRREASLPAPVVPSPAPARQENSSAKSKRPALDNTAKSSPKPKTVPPTAAGNNTPAEDKREPARIKLD